MLIYVLEKNCWGIYAVAQSIWTEIFDFFFLGGGEVGIGRGKCGLNVRNNFQGKLWISL